jgi:hypothetical protein
LSACAQRAASGSRVPTVAVGQVFGAAGESERLLAAQRERAERRLAGVRGQGAGDEGPAELERGVHRAAARGVGDHRRGGRAVARADLERELLEGEHADVFRRGGRFERSAPCLRVVRLPRAQGPGIETGAGVRREVRRDLEDVDGAIAVSREPPQDARFQVEGRGDRGFVRAERALYESVGGGERLVPLAQGGRERRRGDEVGGLVPVQSSEIDERFVRQPG